MASARAGMDAGAIRRFSLKGRTRTFSLRNLVTDATNSLALLSCPQLYSRLRGSRFMFFKVSGQSGGAITAGSDFAFTTPKIQLRTSFNLVGKFMARETRFAPDMPSDAGLTASTNANIVQMESGTITQATQVT